MMLTVYFLYVQNIWELTVYRAFRIYPNFGIFINRFVKKYGISMLKQMTFVYFLLFLYRPPLRSVDALCPESIKK